MIPEQTLVTFPEFSDTGTKVKPGDAKYSAGFQEADVLPAEWLNWFLNKASDGISTINSGVASMEKELLNIVTDTGATPDVNTNNQVLTAIKALRDAITGVLTNLTTTAKTNLVAAINELVLNEGTLSNLSTTAKTNLVAAINELVTNQGTLSSLTTTAKTSLVAAINELVSPAKNPDMSNATNTLAVAHGGTGATSASDARTNLEVQYDKTALYGVWCTTNTGSLTSSSLDSSYYYVLTITAPTGTPTLSEGAIVKIGFKYAMQSNYSSFAGVKLTFGGRTGIIKAARGGSVVTVAPHQFAGGNYSSTYKYKVWDANTTLELMWDGTNWLVMGNPVVCSYFSTSYLYKVYADGFIRQQGSLTPTGASPGTGKHYVIFKQTPVMMRCNYPYSSSGQLYTSGASFSSISTTEFKFTFDSVVPTCTWIASGY